MNATTDNLKRLQALSRGGKSPDLPSDRYEWGLHPAQKQVFESPARFKVCVAGRRFGKTRLATKMALHYALLDKNERGYSLDGMDVHFISPTYAQAEETAMPYLLEDAQDYIAKVNRQKGYLLLHNNRKIWIKSSDRPDNLRGRKSAFVVLDELKDMKQGVWDLIIRPMLVDVEAGALFIGTPSGKTGALYDLYRQAARDEEWETFHFKTLDNPHIADKEVEGARRTLSKQAFQQEFEATFDTAGGSVFDNRLIKVKKQSPRGVNYVGLFLGSRSGMSRNHLSTAGEHSAIVLVTVHPLGWHVKQIQRGRWSTTETLKRLFKVQKEHTPRTVAVPSKQLEIIAPYLADQTKTFNVRPRFVGIADNEATQVDRITWSLQGRLKEGKLTCAPKRTADVIKDQMFDFPSDFAPREALNALSFVDQLPVPVYNLRSTRRFMPLDYVAGY